MFYNLFYQHSADVVSGFNIFKYITFRAGGAFITSLFFALIFGSRFVSFLKKKQKKGQPIRDDGPLSHIVAKQGTPTMGGILILISLVVGSVLWVDLTNFYFWTVLFVTVAYGLLGFWDDYLKVARQNTKGVSFRMKMSIQILVALIALLLLHLYSTSHTETKVYLPYLKNLVIDLGVFFYLFAFVVIIGSSNAVNLTDGLDGLAIGPVIFVGLVFAIFSYVAGNAVFSSYLYLPNIEGAGELTVFFGALVGAGLGFLWFNAPPAQVFMGDTGSLALGGAFGVTSVIVKQEFILAIAGGLFVAEALSVMIQVAYYKATGGKRIFLMAPLHHHFEKKGWAEPTIVIRFWIISIILAVIALSSLKIR
jgi:phospho-N-acetylmuramoyl-pentapeptide-transferase